VRDESPAGLLDLLIADLEVVEPHGAVVFEVTAQRLLDTAIVGRTRDVRPSSF